MEAGIRFYLFQTNLVWLGLAEPTMIYGSYGNTCLQTDELILYGYIFLHFQSKLLIFETVYNLMKYINTIDSCQAHLLVQYDSNIKFIRQK